MCNDSASTPPSFSAFAFLCASGVAPGFQLMYPTPVPLRKGCEACFEQHRNERQTEYGEAMLRKVT